MAPVFRSQIQIWTFDERRQNRHTMLTSPDIFVIKKTRELCHTTSHSIMARWNVSTHEWSSHWK